MGIEQIILMAVAAGPSLLAIFGIIGACIKICKGFTELKNEVVNTKEYQDVKAQLKIAHQENVELKKKLNELLTKIDHIDRSKEE